MNVASTEPNLPSFPGKRKVHCHCWPTVSKVNASFGMSTNLAHTYKPGTNMATTPTEVKPMSHHSSFLFSGSYAARLSGR